MNTLINCCCFYYRRFKLPEVTIAVCMRCYGLMLANMLESGLSSSGSNPGWGHCALLLDKISYFLRINTGGWGWGGGEIVRWTSILSRED